MKVKTTPGAYFLIGLLLSASACQSPSSSDDLSTIVIPNGGPDGLGSIYSFNKVNGQLGSAVEFTSAVPGKDPVDYVMDDVNNLIGFTRYGGKSGKGLFFKFNVPSRQFEVLFDVDPGAIPDQLIADRGEIFFWSKGDGDQATKKLYVIDFQKKTFVSKTSEYDFESKLSLPMADGKELVSVTAYDNGEKFVGLGNNVQYGPPENPFVIENGSFLFKWMKGESEITEIKTWEHPLTATIAWHNQYALFIDGGELYQFNLKTDSLTSYTLDLGLDGNPLYLAARDGMIYGIGQMNGVYRTFSRAIDVDSYDQWAGDSVVSYPTNFKFFDRLFFLDQGKIMEWSFSDRDAKTAIAFGVNDGETPVADLQTMGENYFGVTTKGGAKSVGALYSISKDFKERKLLYSFAPETGNEPLKIIAVGNSLFGITKRGGKESVGVLFQFDPALGQFQVLYEFTDMSARMPVDMILNNNKLYIICSGRKFVRGDLLRYDIETSTPTLISSNDWKEPESIMTYENDIYLLAQGIKTKAKSWFKLEATQDTFSPNDILPKQKLMLNNGAYYYLDKGDLMKWSDGTTTSVFNFAANDRQTYLQSAGDYLLVSTWPDWNHLRPNGSNIYSYNTKTNKSETLLKGSD